MKKWMYAAVIGMLAVGLTSCKGNTQQAQSSESASEAVTEESGEPESSEESETYTGAAKLPNPFVELDGPEGLKEIGLSMEAPEGAEDVHYMTIDGEVGEITFQLEDRSYTYRGAVHAEDFAGIFEEFEDEISALSDCGADEDLIVKTTVSGGRLASWAKRGAKYTLYTADPAEDEAIFTLCIELIGKN